MVRDDLWIGLAHLVPVRGNDSLEGAAGGFSHVIAAAASEGRFRELVRAAATSHRFTLMKLDQVRRLQEHLASEELSGELAQIACQVAADEVLRFATFYTYDSH